MVRSYRMTKDGESTENRYFITSLKDVKLAAKAMRAHWSIETTFTGYWTLFLTRIIAGSEKITVHRI